VLLPFVMISQAFDGAVGDAQAATASSAAAETKRAIERRIVICGTSM
jgi:hypothetical protein